VLAISPTKKVCLFYYFVNFIGFEVGINNDTTSETHFGCNLKEANVWPTEDELPGFKQFCDQLYAQCMKLGDTLMQLIAISMNLPEDFFKAMFHPTLSTLRFLHYPRRASTNSDEIQLSGPAHTDSGFVTLLFQDDVGGLEVCDEMGRWVPVVPIKDAIIVNIGDLLSRWSNNKLVATLHRVRATQADRYSIPFFYEPSYDASIDPINGSTRTYGDYLNERMSAWVEYTTFNEKAEYIYSLPDQLL
jgi:isopenicillin N synthase-like dioxygenase